jgi:hypothetical protein
MVEFEGGLVYADLREVAVQVRTGGGYEYRRCRVVGYIRYGEDELAVVGGGETLDGARLALVAIDCRADADGGVYEVGRRVPTRERQEKEGT